MGISDNCIVPASKEPIVAANCSVRALTAEWIRTNFVSVLEYSLYSTSELVTNFRTGRVKPQLACPLCHFLAKLFR